MARPSPTRIGRSTRPICSDQASTLVSVQSVVVDPADRLWILDTGSIMFQPTEYGGPEARLRRPGDGSRRADYPFPAERGSADEYVNDVRFDLQLGDAAGMAFVTDSSQNGPNGIIVVDLGNQARAGAACTTIPRPSRRRCRTSCRSSRGGRSCNATPMARSSSVRQWARTASPSAPMANAFSTARWPAAASTASRSTCLSTARMMRRRWSPPSWTRGIAAAPRTDSNRTRMAIIYSTNYEHNAILRRGADGIWQTHRP